MVCPLIGVSWWRHQMEAFSALLAICVGNSPVPGEFLTKRPVTRSFDVFLDLRLNKRLSKQWWAWWFEAPSSPLWRHWNVACCLCFTIVKYSWHNSVVLLLTFQHTTNYDMVISGIEECGYIGSRISYINLTFVSATINIDQLLVIDSA